MVRSPEPSGKAPLAQMSLCWKHAVWLTFVTGKMMIKYQHGYPFYVSPMQLVFTGPTSVQEKSRDLTINWSITVWFCSLSSRRNNHTSADLVMLLLGALFQLRLYSQSVSLRPVVVSQPLNNSALMCQRPRHSCPVITIHSSAATSQSAWTKMPVRQQHWVTCHEIFVVCWSSWAAPSSGLIQRAEESFILIQVNLL